MKNFQNRSFNSDSASKYVDKLCISERQGHHISERREGRFWDQQSRGRFFTSRVRLHVNLDVLDFYLFLSLFLYSEESFLPVSIMSSSAYVNFFDLC